MTTSARLRDMHILYIQNDQLVLTLAHKNRRRRGEESGKMISGKLLVLLRRCMCTYICTYTCLSLLRKALPLTSSQGGKSLSLARERAGRLALSLSLSRVLLLLARSLAYSRTEPFTLFFRPFFFFVHTRVQGTLHGIRRGSMPGLRAGAFLPTVNKTPANQDREKERESGMILKDSYTTTPRDTQLAATGTPRDSQQESGSTPKDSLASTPRKMQSREGKGGGLEKTDSGQINQVEMTGLVDSYWEKTLQVTASLLLPAPPLSPPPPPTYPLSLSVLFSLGLSVLLSVLD